MRSDKVKKRLKKHLKELQSAYNHVRENFDQKDTHTFRLHVKKLNAFLWLLNGEKPDGDLKLKKPLHHFYHSVGAIRNLQLHQKRVDDLCALQKLSRPINYLQLLHQKETEAKKSAREEAAQLDIRTFFDKLTRAAPKRVTNATVKHFFTANLVTLIHLLARPVPRDEDLHEVRKTLKRFLYTWPWIKAKLRNDVHTQLLRRKDCDELTTKLGDFIDSSVALRFFDTSYWAGNTSVEEDTALHLLQAHVAANKKRQYEHVLMALKTLFPSSESGRVTRFRLSSMAGP